MKITRNLIQSFENIIDGYYYNESVLLTVMSYTNTTDDENHSINRYLKGSATTSDRFVLQDLVVRLKATTK